MRGPLGTFALSLWLAAAFAFRGNVPLPFRMGRVDRLQRISAMPSDEFGDKEREELFSDLWRNTPAGIANLDPKVLALMEDANPMLAEFYKGKAEIRELLRKSGIQYTTGAGEAEAKEAGEGDGDEDEDVEEEEVDEEEEEDDAKGESQENELQGELPRLHADLGSMVRWIERSGGVVDAAVKEELEGWTLHANRRLTAGATIISIPKSLCLFSDPELMENPLLENAQVLLKSLDRRHWRARLAIALLSERVRPSSFFRAFLRNLPFEFWGMPVFFSTSEFGMMQDLTLMQKTRDRCRFLSEFADNVLLPLQKTSRDPFSGNSADVNAFGWGFASASSRALRNPSVVGPSGGAVMVPGIDIASHSNAPNCVVVDDGGAFVLQTLRDVEADEELTINYGALGNDELFSDFGFTVDNNPNDRMELSCDPFLINSARAVMGQCRPEGEGAAHTLAATLAAEVPMQSPTAAIQRTFGSLQNYNASSLASAAAALSPPGRIGTSDRYNERQLHGWQTHWLRVLGLVGPGASYGMTLGSPSPSAVDPRLWAYLRVLYAPSEETLTANGYDPFILQHCGSMLPPKYEAHVVKTLVGMLAVLFRIYGTDHEKDLFLLRTEMAEDASEAGLAGLDGSPGAISAQSDDIVSDAHRILRSIFKIPHPQVASLSPTVRRMQQSLAPPFPDEGSVEDMVRLSLSKAVLRPPALASAEGESPGALADTSSGLPEDAKNDDAARAAQRGTEQQDLDSLGMGLPVNVREALRYRIRRKRALADLILNLGDLYKRLQSLDGSIEDLLPLNLEDRQERRAKIRELMDEVRNQQGDREDVLSISSKISEKFSRGGLNL